MKRRKVQSRVRAFKTIFGQQKKMMKGNKQHLKLFATLNWGKLHLFYLVKVVCVKGTFLHYGVNSLEHSLHIGQTVDDPTILVRLCIGTI